ncbi:MAG: insulinase family protein [Bacteroidetes bacterium]|nr:insulinase family protein [Bacteroidota bacterium]
MVYIPYSNPKVSYCSLIIDAGSANETKTERGMAHFMEHMMFKGTASRKSIDIISELDNVGGELNAFTTKEKTCIHASIGTNHLEKAINLIADIAMFSQFPEKEIEKEKQIVHDEINMYLDNPEESIYDDFLEALFPNHPLGKTILGSHEEVDKFSQEKLLKFIKNHYATSNMVFTFFTGLSEEKIEAMLTSATSEYTKSNKKVKVLDSLAPYKKFSLTKKAEFVQAHCILGSRVCSVRDDEKYALSMLNNILGGPYMNSRLNLAIREKHGFCYSIYSDIQLFKTSGVFTINFATETKYIDKCKGLIFKELQTLCDKGVNKKQFNIALDQVAGQLELSWDNPSGLVTTLGNALIDNEKVLTSNEVYEKYKKLNSEILLKVANKYMKPQHQSEFLYIPSK